MIFFKRNPMAMGVLISLVSVAAIASGSDAGSSGAQTSDAYLYNSGKGVYADKFACSGCPLAGKSLTAEIAKEVLAGSPKVQLSNDEQSAVTVYLKRRFKI